MKKLNIYLTIFLRFLLVSNRFFALRDLLFVERSNHKVPFLFKKQFITRIKPSADLIGS